MEPANAGTALRVGLSARRNQINDLIWATIDLDAVCSLLLRPQIW